MTIHVGPVRIEDPVLLAPMSGVSDLPYRRIVKQWGAGLVVSEMIASQAMIRHNRKTMKMASNCAEEFPMSVQLAGYHPDVMAEAAKLNEGRGAAIIDINMGCPVKKVVSHYSGSALMRDLDHARLIIEATVNAVSLPVTLKMRTGWDDDSRNAPELARIAEDCGIKMITVHGRTRCKMYRGSADWRFIAKVKQAVDIPVIANGDVKTLDDVSEIMEQSNADGIMIGRGSYGRPWFPAQAIQFLRNGERIPDPPPAEQYAALKSHYEHMLEHYGPDIGVRAARKHLGWYSKGLRGGAEFRAQINQLSDPVEVCRLIDVFYGAAREQAEAA
jgi:tRNA-dihydrouridine synthase B